MITWNTCLAFMIMYGLWRGRMTGLERLGINSIPKYFERQKWVETILFGCFAGFMTSSMIVIGPPLSGIWILLPYLLSMLVGSWYVNVNKDRYLSPSQMTDGAYQRTFDYASTSLFDYPNFEKEERVPLQIEQSKSRTL